MRMRQPLRALLCLFVLLASGQTLRARLDTVRIDAGSLSGVTGASGVTAFLGIPFAAPPVGDLRWKPPQPVAPWEGVRKADKFGTSCMQNQAGSRLPWTEEFMTQGSRDPAWFCIQLVPNLSA